MKQLFDFLPLLAFFITYKMYDIYTATAALIVATIIQVLGARFIWKKVEKVHVITLVMVLVFGSLTLFFRDDAFIKWKVTAIYGAMALALFIGQAVFKKSFLKSLMGGELSLPEQIYFQLGYAWALFFSICGALNVYVAFHLSQETWVNFKVFGLTALTIVFALLQGIYIWKYLPKETSDPLEQSKE